MINSADAVTVSETTTGLGIVEIGASALTALGSATGEMKVEVYYRIGNTGCRYLSGDVVSSPSSY